MRPVAERDLIDATRWYAGQGGLALGAKAFDAAHAALEPIPRMPGLGSPRLGNECGLPGLRQCLLNGLLAVATLLPMPSAQPLVVFASGALFGSVFLSVVAATTALVRHSLPAPR